MCLLQAVPDVVLGYHVFVELPETVHSGLQRIQSGPRISISDARQEAQRGFRHR